MPVCAGTAKDHCCYVLGKPCRFLEENAVPGRRWTCKLRRELGDWVKVHADPRYLKHVKPVWIEIGMADCGDWPLPDDHCAVCGVKGDG